MVLQRCASSGLCGKPFETFGDMQRHELIKHVQEGAFDNQTQK
jgi:hypothetical protein